jgi:hypothetical protein
MGRIFLTADLADLLRMSFEEAFPKVGVQVELTGINETTGCVSLKVHLTSINGRRLGTFEDDIRLIGVGSTIQVVLPLDMSKLITFHDR